VEQEGRGKGGALVQGFMAARGEVIVTLDADGSADSAEIPRFVEALEAGAHFAKGSRYLSGGGSDDLTLLRSAGNRFLSAVTNILFGTAYTDLCYGYNAFRRECIPHFQGGGTGFEIETLMHIRAVQAGLTVVEVPSHESRRRFGNSHLRPFRDGFRILQVIVRERMSSPRGSRGKTEELAV
jgi:glycosyltransferase involved in cell wall biosynthesis